MKILYVTTVGITMRFFESLIFDLIQYGETVDIATNEINGECPVPACYREWGCKVFPISCSRSPFSKQNAVAIKEIKVIVNNGNYDIVHCHTPIAAACTRLACRELREKGTKIIYTAHGFHFFKGAPLKNWLLYYPVEWLCAHWTDVLITINKEDYQLAKKHMHAKHVEYVPGVGIDVKRFADAQADHAEKRREIGVPEDAVLLVSVGELNENKNHAVVVKALAQMNDSNIHYAIAGAGPLRDQLRRLAESLGVGTQVHLLGYRQDVPELYKVADICVFPSIREGQGLAAIEGMAVGLPIVSSDNRGMRDILISGENAFICCFNDADAFAAAIHKLTADKNLRAKYGAANRQKVANYDVAIINEIMGRIYSHN